MPARRRSRRASVRKNNRPAVRRRNLFVVLSDLLFDRKARKRKLPNRRPLLQPLEDRRMMASLIYGQEVNDEPRHLSGDDRLTGEKTVTAGGLTYSSATMPHPIITAEATLAGGITTLTSFDVEVRLISPDGPTYDAVGNKHYDATGVESGNWLRFAAQVDASSFVTGNYDWEMTVTSHFSDQADTEDYIEGQQFLVSRIDTDQFADGWWLNGLDRVHDTLDGAGLVDSTGMVVFFPDDGIGGYEVQDHDQRFIDSFVQNVDDTYTLTYVDGNVSEFDDGGFLTARIDRNGNETAYSYTDTHLTTIADDVSGRETSLAYNGTTDLLESITTFDGRSTLFEYTGRQLTSVVLPAPDAISDPPEVNFTYAASGDDAGLLTSIVDESNFTTGQSHVQCVQPK